MTLFIINTVSISMVAMAGFFLIILREKLETQLIMAGVVLEAIVALASLLFIQESDLNANFLATRVIGRTIEAGVMWFVIISEARTMRRESILPPAVEIFQKQINELKQQIVEIAPKEKHENEEVN